MKQGEAMRSAQVIAICTAPVLGAPLHSVPSVQAVPGRGLEGDRKFNSGKIHEHGAKAAGTQLTLIESEALEALERETSIKLQPGESRRNIITRGVALNHLVGKEFNVGEVRVLGLRLCEPCDHLESLTQQGVLRGLIHRGGLRAEILTKGVIRVGDQISAAPHHAAAAAAG